MSENQETQETQEDILANFQVCFFSKFVHDLKFHV